MSAVKPGFYKGVSYDDYAAWDAIRSSDLKPFERSAQHARYDLLHQKDASHFRVGRAVHTAVLEPEKFVGEYVAAPKLDRRTKAGKEAWAQFEADNGDRVILTADEFALASSLHGAIKKGETKAARAARDILFECLGQNEASALWELEGGGLGKARVDRLCSWQGIPTIVDLKSTKDASPDGFRREILKYGYHVSAAWYTDGLAQVAPCERRFVFIAVEKAPPFAVGVYVLDGEFLEIGRAQAKEWLRRLQLARETDQWDSYPVGTMFAPEWLYKQYEEATFG